MDEINDVRHTASADWQAEGSDEQRAALGAYLEQMAAIPMAREAAERSLALLRLHTGQRVLEVGCGTGVFLPVLAAAVGSGGHVEAVDHTPQFVTAAQERVHAASLSANVTVRQADAYHLPYPDATFDAAHCERVLIHLDDPTAVLREMRRVVKPGGLVVAAEPHHLGTQIDGPDPEAMTLFLHRFLTHTIRQPRIGLELNRRLFDAGLVERTVEPLVAFVRGYADVAASGFDPTATADALVAEGVITRERIDALFAALQRASDEGSFAAYWVMIVGAGRAPGDMRPVP
jgi:ubiquinone/menaquinone biosynthesis C-methylase UbiE